MTEKDIEGLLLKCTGDKTEEILEQEMQKIHEELLCRQWEKIESFLGGAMTKLM